MERRLECLKGIPFAAIFTTNFDNLLSGVDPQSTEAFGRLAATVLREKKSEFQRLQEIAFSSLSSGSTPVFRLHGDVSREGSELVCTREGYRRMLHGATRYSDFVRTLLATHVVLFLGFSFTDNYLNKLRSEVISLFAQQHGRPLAYALLPDVPHVKRSALLKHDGLEVINFDTRGGTDFSGFTSTLQQLHAGTNPTVSIGRVLHQRHVLWLHTNWASSRDTRCVHDYLERATALAQGVDAPTCTFRVMASAAEAVHAVREGAEARGTRVDAVISIFDSRVQASAGEEIGAATFELLRALRAVPEAPPVLIFGCGGEDEEEARIVRERRSRCVREGARGYTFYYYELVE